MLFRVALHFRDSPHHCTLEVLFEHCPYGLRQSWVCTNRKVQSTYLSLLNQSTERRQWLAVAAIVIFCRLITFFGWAKSPFNSGVVIEQGEEDRDAFYDTSTQLRFNLFPIVVEPTF